MEFNEVCSLSDNTNFSADYTGCCYNICLRNKIHLSIYPLDMNVYVYSHSNTVWGQSLSHVYTSEAKHNQSQ